MIPIFVFIFCDVVQVVTPKTHHWLIRPCLTLGRNLHHGTVQHRQIIRRFATMSSLDICPWMYVVEGNFGLWVAKYYVVSRVDAQPHYCRLFSLAALHLSHAQPMPMPGCKAPEFYYWPARHLSCFLGTILLRKELTTAMYKVCDERLWTTS
jgi:hypothetical protein